MRLTGQEIRLVILEPSEVAESSIVCRPKAAKLSARPIYEAFPWAWGDASCSAEIILQGRTWRAPENLVRAPRCLRLVDHARTFWIDALSINQSIDLATLQERGHQVQLMKYIYNIASHVVIWMGVPVGVFAEFLVTYAFQNRSVVDAVRENPCGTIHMLTTLFTLA